MTGTLRIIGSFIAAAIVTVCIIMAWPMPVHAQGIQCVSIEADRALYDKPGSGFDYLGVLPAPYTDGVAVYYRRQNDNATVMSPVINGCVSPNAYTMGRYVGPPIAPPKPPATPSAAPIPAPIPSFRMALIDRGRMLSDYLEFRNLAE